MQVINETLRMANMAPIMYRKAVNDVEIKGKYHSSMAALEVKILYILYFKVEIVDQKNK
jgi:hypothetical protein